MKHLLAATLFSVTLAVGLAPPAAAQSDILLRLRSGSPPGDRFRVDSAGGVVARSFIGIGIIPQSGAGDRMMWHPFKGAFRAGGVDDTQWDEGNVGFYTLAAGFNPTAAGYYSVAMGYGSRTGTLGQYGFAMGNTSHANGTAAVAIGFRTTADSDYGVALGHRASTNGHDGAFVIADQSTSDSLEASANNQFSARYAGGYRLFTNATKTTGVSLNAGGSSWNVISDRDRKESFLGIDGEDVLARIRSLPVSTWRYRGEEDRTVRHIGPMAQDWQRAFGFSRDETTINMSDFDGVNLAAIQALEVRSRAQADEIRTLRTENAALRAANAEMERRLRRLESLLPASGAP